MQPKTVLYLDHTPFIGGAQLVLVSHFKHLDKTRFRPIIGVDQVCPKKLLQLYAEALSLRQVRPASRSDLPTGLTSTRVFKLPFSQLKTLNPAIFLRFLQSVWVIIKLIRREKVDLVVTNTERAMYSGTIAALLTHRPVVWWIRDYCYSRPLFRLLRWIPRHIIFVSRTLHQFYMRKPRGCSLLKIGPLKRLNHSPLKVRPFISCNGGVSGVIHQTSVVYVGSDFDERLREVREEEEVQKLREEWGVDGDTIVIGFVSRLVRWKGGMVLLQAAARLRKKGQAFKVVVIGSGGGQEGSNEAEMRRFVREQGLENDVILAGFREDIPACMSTFDIFVHPPIEPEPFATTVVEAMLAGVAVIGVDHGGDPEIIKDGETGFLVPPGDPVALAGTLWQLITDPELRKRVGEQGRGYARENNTEGVTTGQVEGVFEVVLGITNF